jgi:hypothetical protein
MDPRKPAMSLKNGITIARTVVVITKIVSPDDHKKVYLDFEFAASFRVLEKFMRESTKSTNLDQIFGRHLSVTMHTACYDTVPVGYPFLSFIKQLVILRHFNYHLIKQPQLKL